MLSEIEVFQENAGLGLLMPFPPDGDQTHIENMFGNQRISPTPALKQKPNKRQKCFQGRDLFLFSWPFPFAILIISFVLNSSPVHFLIHQILRSFFHVLFSVVARVAQSLEY